MHQQNFIDAVRSRDSSSLNADVEVGHDSTGWCNLANIAFQTGKPFTHKDAGQVSGDHGIWQSMVEEMQKHLATHSVKIESDDIMLSPMLTVDSDQDKFVGDHADAANAFWKREYRAPYVVPEIEA